MGVFPSDKDLILPLIQNKMLRQSELGTNYIMYVVLE